MVPFSSATFPEDEDNDPDFNPLELKKVKIINKYKVYL